MRTARMMVATALVLASVPAAGCRDDKGSRQATTGAAACRACCPGTDIAGGLPPGLLLSEPPQGAAGVAEVMASAEDGLDVTLSGRVGGHRNPFVAGRAVVLLVDPALPSCDSKGDDHCPTPWDYCCEPPDELARNTVTVQVDDPDGRPLRTDLAGLGGLAPLKTVIVQGTVRRNAAGAATVSARGIYVSP